MPAWRVELANRCSSIHLGCQNDVGWEGAGLLRRCILVQSTPAVVEGAELLVLRLLEHLQACEIGLTLLATVTVTARTVQSVNMPPHGWESHQTNGAGADGQVTNDGRQQQITVKVCA
jgi:hypothetical protein